MGCLFREEQFEMRSQAAAAKQPFQPPEDFRSEQCAATFQTNCAELLFIFFFVCKSPFGNLVWEISDTNSFNLIYNCIKNI